MEEKKKGNIGLIILVIILLIACIGMGSFIFINKDKITKEAKSDTVEANNKIDNTAKEEEIEEETTTSNTATEENSYIEKVYSMNNETIVLFKSGNCVVKSNLEYTAHCKYTIDNNVITMTRHITGPNDGSEKTFTYNIIEETYDEYIELSTDKNQRYKLLKEYS